MRHFLRSLAHAILISLSMGLHGSVFHHYVSWIPDFLIGFGGSPHSDATNNQCLCPSYTFFPRQNFGAPFIELASFGVLLYLCAINIRFQGFLVSWLLVTVFGSTFLWSFP